MFAYEELDFRDVFSRILTPSSGTAFRGSVRVKIYFMKRTVWYKFDCPYVGWQDNVLEQRVQRSVGCEPWRWVHWTLCPYPRRERNLFRNAGECRVIFILNSVIVKIHVAMLLNMSTYETNYIIKKCCSLIAILWL